jgi:hypothetical protein
MMHRTRKENVKHYNMSQHDSERRGEQVTYLSSLVDVVSFECAWAHAHTYLESLGVVRQ